VSELSIGSGGDAPRKTSSMGVLHAAKTKQERMLIAHADPNSNVHDFPDWISYCKEVYGTDSSQYGEAVNWDERYTGDL
jgi:hypothetical protein